MTLPVPAASTWFTNQLVDASKVDTYIVNPINELDDRTADSGWGTGGVLVAAGSSSAITDTRMRQAGPNLSLRGTVTLGTAITVGTDGNTANTQVAQISNPAFWPSEIQGIGMLATGPLQMYLVNTTGQVLLVAVAPGAVLSVGSQLSFSGAVML